jgi:branched-chain amino acid aminotransferase
MILSRRIATRIVSAISTRYPQRSALRCISSSQLTIERTTDSSRFDNRPAKEELQFGATMSDHMLTVEWTTEGGWASPKIIPYQDLRISPAASCLHYGE